MQSVVLLIPRSTVGHARQLALDPGQVRHAVDVERSREGHARLFVAPPPAPEPPPVDDAGSAGICTRGVIVGVIGTDSAADIEAMMSAAVARTLGFAASSPAS